MRLVKHDEIREAYLNAERARIALWDMLGVCQMFCAFALNKGIHRRWALTLSGKKIESWSRICPQF